MVSATPLPHKASAISIVIASGKGGTGKTTLATNLSAFLSDTEDVLLTDLDVEEPDSRLFLKGPCVREKVMYKEIPEWSSETCVLCDLCKDVCNFGAIVKIGAEIQIIPELCHSCYACSELCPTSSLPMMPQRMGVLREYKINNHLTVIESRLDIGQEQAVPLIKETHRFVTSHFAQPIIKLFDAPPGASCPVIEATRDADKVILVTEPTPFGLHDLKIIVESMRILKVPLAVVINRSGTGNDAVRDYCKSEGLDIIAEIPDDRRIAELYSAGELIYDKVPKVKVAMEKMRTFILRTRKELVSK